MPPALLGQSLLYTKLPEPDPSEEGPPSFLPVLCTSSHWADSCSYCSQRTKDGGASHQHGQISENTPE